MSNRRGISNKYRMEITAKEECQFCFGTGMRIEQSANKYSNKIEILLSVCPCVRVVPRLVHDPHSRPDVILEDTP